MKKLAVVVLVLAVAVMFAVPAFAGSGCGSSTCNKCAQPKACPTCGQPCNIIQSTANVISGMQAPNLCLKCGTCPKPCNTCPKPCNTCTK